MKILHIVSSLNVGGAERFVIDLAIEQEISLNLNVAILSMGNKKEPLEDEVHKNNISLLHETNISKLSVIFKQYDVIHVHSSHCLLRALLASLFQPVRVIYTRHNEVVHTTFKWKVTYLLAYLKLYKMIFVAEKAKSNYLKVYSFFEKKSQAILNGVLPMSKEKLVSNSIRLSHVGRFVELKSQHILIEAVAQLPEHLQNKIEVSFFGTGPLLNKNKELAKQETPNVLVNFKGFVTDRNEIYQNTDIIIVTSETEGLSLAILESLASGTPVIASDVGGNPELVNNGVNGFLYEYGDENTLAKKIAKLIEEKELYKNFSSESIKKYQQNFSMNKCAQEYLLSYK